MTMALETSCREFLSGFLLMFANRYRKIDSPENREAITLRMTSYGIVPSITSAKRAILELIDEGEIDRVDGLTAEDDARLEKESADRREQVRLADLRSKGCPTSRSEYFAIPNREILLRYRREPDFKSAVDHLIAAGQI
jgi:hypothetical protein